jgi:CheY-like chemotaxis protein
MGGELKLASTPGAGSVFRIQLFLPEVSGPVDAAGPAPARTRRGYEGPRRRILVVDNEEADRDLLAHLLEPLGFELRNAANGHDALDLLAAGLRPDAILMDLAMPGIDGWETIRRIRRLGHDNAKVAIVSANAFDKGLDNDVGVRPEDFILKPVRHTELLDWLERQLGLRWLEQAPAAPAEPPAAAGEWHWPAPGELAALQQAVQLGYYRGIVNQLDAIVAAQPGCAAFAATMRELARQFQFEAMSRKLAQAPAGVVEKLP